MLKAAMDRIPTSVKVQMALRAIGFSGDEKAAMDALIARYGASPLGATLLGEATSSTEGLVARIVDKLVSDGQSLGQDAAPIGRLLAVPQLRQFVTHLVVSHIEAQPEAGALFSALNKLSDVPGAPWANRDFDTVPEFIDEGLLPALSDIIMATADGQDDKPLVVRGFVRCPYCKSVHGA